MLSFLFALSALSATDVNATGYVSGTQVEVKYVTDPVNGTCWATWTNSTADDAWFKYTVWTHPSAAALDQARCAGFLNGFLGHSAIYPAVILAKEASSPNFSRSLPYPTQIVDFMNANIQFARDETSGAVDDYWQRIGVIFELFNGLADGYNASNSTENPLTYMDLWIHQANGALGDLMAKFGLAPLLDLRRARCTGAVRLLPEFSDIFVTHNTWSDYRLLHAIIIQYNFHIPFFTAQTLTLTTRVGMLGSLDDFYVSENGLITFETSTMNQNETLTSFCKPESLMTWIRALMGQFSADGWQEWVDLFMKYNSGTYNNDYYVTDVRRFEVGARPIRDLVWLVE
jgi:hypothetical protein